MNDFGIKDSYLKYISNFFKQFDNIDIVKIYGSRSRGDYRKNSDVDLVLYGDNIDFIQFAYIKDGLYILPTPYKFDVTDYNSITNQDFKDEIDKDGKIIYEKP